MVGGTVLSALAHPWFYALACFDLATSGLLTRPESLLGWPFWLIAWFNLSVGYLASMGLALLEARLRHAAQADSADAALLAADLGGGLPGALAIHDRALRMGEDRAWSRPARGSGGRRIG